MKKGLHILVLYSLIFAICGVSLACLSSSQSPAQEALYLTRQMVQEEMEKLDNDLRKASNDLADRDLSSEFARSLLSKLMGNRPYIVDIATVDDSGKIAAIEPADYRKSEGSYISRQEHIIRLFRTHQPVLSQNFTTVEGFDAASLEQPLFSTTNEFRGAVSVLFKPEVLLESIIAPIVKDQNFAIWAMQPDGRIIYDIDTEEIGKNTFQDPMFQSYPALLEVGREMQVKKAGTGEYEFLNTGLKQTVKKSTEWTTFEMHGTEWRIIANQVVQ